MRKPVLVVDPNEESRSGLCTVLQRHHYQCIALQSLEELEGNVQVGELAVVVLDLDTLPIDNRFFRNMKRQHPTVQIMVLSSRTFHPELEEAMSQHISSCLSKPVEEEELLFWVKSLFENINEAS